MSQWLSTLDALVEDPDLFSNIQMGNHSSSSRGGIALFLLLWAPGTGVVHIHACKQNSLMHKLQKTSL